MTHFNFACNLYLTIISLNYSLKQEKGKKKKKRKRDATE